MIGGKDTIHLLDEIARQKRIDKETAFKALEESLKSVVKVNYPDVEDDRIVAKIDRETGELTLEIIKDVVEKVENPAVQIDVKKASAIRPSVKPGDKVAVPVSVEELGRIGAHKVKEEFLRRIAEAENVSIVEDFQGRIGDAITGKVMRWGKGGVIVDLGRAEGFLPSTEIPPGEEFRQGMRIKVYIMSIKYEPGERRPRKPQIILSRTHPNFLRRLFEIEVPEIADGTVEIKALAREPGYRSKIAVYSKRMDVDPVGACIGMRGARIQAVRKELGNEKIDIVKWDPDEIKFIENALSPAKTYKIIVLDDVKKHALVIVRDEDLSAAIGKDGRNIRLASKLTGWKLEVKGLSDYERMREELVQQAREALAGAKDEETETS